MSIPYRGRNLPTKTQGAQGRLSSILKFDISGYTETEGFFRAARRESVPRDVAFHCRGPRRLRHLRFEYHRWDSDKLFATSTSCCSSFSILGSSTSRTSPIGSTRIAWSAPRASRGSLARRCAAESNLVCEAYSWLAREKWSTLPRVCERDGAGDSPL